MADYATNQIGVGLSRYIVPLETGPTDMLGKLTIVRRPGSIRVTLKSTKWRNIIVNWKNFLFDVVPVTVSAATVIPDSAIAAVAAGLQAVKAAADSMEINLPDQASEAILCIAAMERSTDSKWIPIDVVSRECKVRGIEDEHLNDIMRELEKLGVLRLDLEDKHVRIVEEMAFVSTSE